MNQTVNAQNASLYNTHANKYATREEAQQQREAGMALPLKKLHNRIKRLLIQRFAADSNALLDLACGRGGDLLKWVDCEISYVRGYDIAEEEVKEAQARLEQLRQESPKRVAHFSADFLATSDIGNKAWLDEKGPYDAVTCMFALHYFFHSEAAADAVLKMAAMNLRPGGHFFGVLPDGKNVQEAIGPDMKPKALKAVKLAPKWKGPPRPFGSPYTCALTDTVTEGGDDGSGSLEYLVFQSVLVPLAAKHDLHPVVDYGSEALDRVLAPPVASSNGAQLFRRFRASFEKAHPSLEVASQLNCAFVLRKGRPGSDAAPPPARVPDGSRGVMRAREADEEDGSDGEGEPNGGAAADAAALEAERLKRVQAGYARPQYKRSSKFKRTV